MMADSNNGKALKPTLPSRVTPRLACSPKPEHSVPGWPKAVVGGKRAGAYNADITH
ncbi:hypothetical protein [Paludibacterium denitrificans]|uniref:Uncharacterized protein n=1 Tax=Paludibacterium denitrificans TaxID=2675226 RepID=A0A844GD38_9NEIS|nr:hypothetical protein [Paludibacterium denitrificans]MTD33148.1 hypothetical protein [Paludibacterium denitrificans]